MAALSRPWKIALVLAAAWAVLIVATAAHKSGDLPPQLGLAAAGLPRLLVTAPDLRFLAANNDTLGALLLLALLLIGRRVAPHPNPRPA